MDNVGGMQRVALKLNEALHERSEPPHVESVLLRSSWKWTPYKVPFFLGKAAWRIRQAVLRNEADVVLFSSMVTAALAVPLRGFLDRHNVKTAAITHGLDVTLSVSAYQWFVPKVFGALDAVLPVSRATGAACVARGMPADQVHVVPNGIDLDRYAPPQSKSEMRADLSEALGSKTAPLPNDALLLCSVGRQVKRKGVAWFVEHVMPTLPEHVHYWIAGDGPQSSAIQDAIDRNNLNERVRRLGRISNPDLARLYRGADLFIMPNIPVEGDMEGFGVVMLEAGQCGCPSIAARLEGIQDVITEGENGHLVESENPASFREAIMQYNQAPEQLRQISERAVQHTESNFGWSAVAEQYVDVLRAVVDPDAAPQGDSLPGAPVEVGVHAETMA
ncbi:glycosyl transferase family 1 [Longimonas halophila]|uniref:Glycosyl transferase family 1 n=2 Tax=Longimonas halophila TaxID=1469170 RepID=A0A2H3NKN8_9BACT|nr:glycosyl transferase family 1 [Longimonas halophila]